MPARVNITNTGHWNACLWEKLYSFELLYPRIGKMDTQTQTHRHTDTQNDYCNPHCACALRVNKLTTVAVQSELVYIKSIW